jgi:type I restriction enzyme, S subunit
MSFPRYPKYKDSGVEWLGEVPEHWEVSRIKYLAQIESGHTPSRSVEEYWLNCTIPWVSLNDSSYLRQNDYISDTAYRISELGMANSSAHLLPARAVVFSRDATVGLCAITTQPMAVSQHFIAYLCGPKLVPEYLLLSLKAMSQHLEHLSLGATIATIGMDDVRSLVSAAPPLPEQRAIIEFLDRETGKIDELVAEQQRLMELLKEKRQAVISHAVTKGLNPRAPMKPSGIEWLGDVPEHWKMVPLRWASTCCSGDGLPSEEVESVQDEEHTVKTIGGNGLMGYTTKGNIEHSILAVGRVGALCGNIHVVNPPAWITDNALILDADSDVFDLRFLGSVLRSRNLNEIASRTAQPLITGTQVGDQRIPAPPLKEQQVITAFLDVELAEMDALVTEAQKAIDLLQERRTALISAAVTGQIDVRKLAAA